MCWAGRAICKIDLQLLYTKSVLTSHRVSSTPQYRETIYFGRTNRDLAPWTGPGHLPLTSCRRVQEYR